MTEFEAIVYLPGSSHSFESRVRVSEEGTFSIPFEDDVFVYPSNKYEIEPKLGGVNRVVRFSDGARLETSDHEAFASFERRLPQQGFLGIVDWMESRWQFALASVVGIVVFAYVFIEYVMPVVASHIAYGIPQGIREKISEESIEAMQQWGFEESYSRKMHEKGNAAFERALGLVAGEIDNGYGYELRLFKAPNLGPNAFALPSGIIVATESFLELCETEEQAIAVFLHEIAHVEQQHGLRSLIQDAGILLIASLVLGDLSSLGGMAASLPALALESRYSQGFELEADRFAGRVLEEHGIGADVMKDILVLLHADAPDLSFVQFLSSHPELQERIEALDELKSGKLDPLEP